MSHVIELPRSAKIKKSPGPRKEGIQYKDVRPREHLTYEEVMRLVKAAESVGRNRLRDGTLILMAYVHGFRASEICDLKWHQIDLSGRNPMIKILRVKGSIDSDHHLEGDEVRRLRKLDRAYPDSPYVFVTETGNQLTVQGFWTIVRRAGKVAGFQFPIHPHMLRHSCGHRLVNDGVHLRMIQEWMGHKDVQNTEHYTKLGEDRFRGISMLKRPRR
jgi:site-specific recombinase XerD